MFTLTALVYPIVLAILCVGCGLLVDRLCGAALPAGLLVTVGAAALIALSQLSTYVAALAPATPYLMATLAAGGLALALGGGPPRARWRPTLRWVSERRLALLSGALIYALALAPVLLAGRPSFSSYMVLADSAVHMLGADYLLHHGQSYGHLDLSNSYGQFVNAYYNAGYPSGADTLFGGSALLLGLPLIWAFQPFNAFMLATSAGPVWLLARRAGLRGGWAVAATVAAALPAMVYAYELFGSIKEITALPMILTLGALVTGPARWLRGPAAGAIPFGLVAGAGVSALGVGFGAWILASCLVAALALASERGQSRRALWSPRAALRRLAVRSPAPIGVLVIVLLIGAWPTWIDLSSSVRVSENIATTANPGNLRAPLRPEQVLGVWLNRSYQLAPTGVARTLTDALIALSSVACLIGALQLLRTGRRTLVAWLALMLCVWLAISVGATTWVGAKALMLTSPVAALVAWAGVGALAARPGAGALRRAPAALLALALAGGVIGSDVLQYHSSKLAPTRRYDELAAVGARFAGRGPTLFTDFDEYSLYELRALDVGGPNFAYPPAALARIAGGYGRPVDLDRAPPTALVRYPLIVTRRDPVASRPPAAYALAWQGTYYQVWRRRRAAPPALVHLRLGGAAAQAHGALAGARVAADACARIGRLARGVGRLARGGLARGVFARAREDGLVAAASPAVVGIALARTIHPRDWPLQRRSLLLGEGSLTASFTLPHGGAWDLWLRGQLMPAVGLWVDGRRLGSLAGQLDGNSLVLDTMMPLRASLAAGAHRLRIARTGSLLAAGDGSTAALDAIFLTPAADGGAHPLVSAAPERWRSLCGRPYDWVEVVTRRHA
jgi:hypothetical protein